MNFTALVVICKDYLLQVNYYMKNNICLNLLGLSLDYYALVYPKN